MAEYVIDATDTFLGDAFDAREFFGPRLKEEIVRCPDCEFALELSDRVDCSLFDFAFSTGTPGFCFWGVRREC